MLKQRLQSHIWHSSKHLHCEQARLSRLWHAFASNKMTTDAESGRAIKKPRLAHEIAEDGISLGLEASGTGNVAVGAVIEHSTKQTPKKRKSGRARRREAMIALPESCSPEDVLWQDIVGVLGKDIIKKAMDDGRDFEAPVSFKDEITVEIKALGSGGDGIGIISSSATPMNSLGQWCIIVPLTLPGETVRVRVYRNARMHSFADLLEVITPNDAMRDMSRVQCKYFGRCGGCQYQMLSYDTQLQLKRDVIVKAYQNFSGISQSLIPTIGDTIGSPFQYSYRTKITPHFEAPPKSVRKGSITQETLGDGDAPEWLKIGFNRIGTRKVMDIEDCPIATPTIRNALAPARDEIKRNILRYKKAVSLLFRDSLDPTIAIEPPQVTDEEKPSPSLSEAFNRRVCITDHNATVREKVGQEGWIFEYTAGSFFQNNNSILGPLTQYVQEAIFAPWDGSLSVAPNSYSSPSSDALHAGSRPTHLVDAYCGCGLFSITLSPSFTQVAGIELSTSSISAATNNLRLNRMMYPKLVPSEDKCRFLAGDASNIFDVVKGGDGGSFPPDRTVLVIDPPRKGCDENFLQQVIDWRCKAIVYVSCNVHTQARDVGLLVKGTEEKNRLSGGGRYMLESVRGFDLFPQTAHVESVAILRLI